jgi:hypothetical protein
MEEKMNSFNNKILNKKRKRNQKVMKQIEKKKKLRIKEETVVSKQVIKSKGIEF